MKRNVAAAAVLVVALALLSISPTQAASLGDNSEITATPSLGAKATESSKANASATAKCRKARRRARKAKKRYTKDKKRLRRAKKSSTKAKLKRVKRRFRKGKKELKRANKAKRKVCKGASGNAPTAPTANHTPYFQDPFESIGYTSIDLVRSSGFVVEAEVHLTVVEAIDPDGDSLTYTWLPPDSPDSWGPGTVQPSAADPRSATWHVPAQSGYVACGSVSVRVSDGTERGPKDTAYFGSIPKQKSGPSATLSSYIEGLCGHHIS